MKRILLAPLLLIIALAVVPVNVGAQTTELTETQKLAQIAIQLEEIEQEVNRLTLLVTKLTLERQAADLQRQLAALLPADAQPTSVESDSTMVGKEGIAAGSPQSSKADLGGEAPVTSLPAGGEERGPLGNLGMPQLAALAILGILAIFVLVRRLRGGKQESEKSAPVSPLADEPFSQTLSQPQIDLLEERKQGLKENVVWK